LFHRPPSCQLSIDSFSPSTVHETQRPVHDPLSRFPSGQRSTRFVGCVYTSVNFAFLLNPAAITSHQTDGFGQPRTSILFPAAINPPPEQDSAAGSAPPYPMDYADSNDTEIAVNEGFLRRIESMFGTRSMSGLDASIRQFADFLSEARKLPRLRARGPIYHSRNLRRFGLSHTRNICAPSAMRALNTQIWTDISKIATGGYLRQAPSTRRCSCNSPGWSAWQGKSRSGGGGSVRGAIARQNLTNTRKFPLMY
jgi:hypothetical protein